MMSALPMGTWEHRLAVAAIVYYILEMQPKGYPQINSHAALPMDWQEAQCCSINSEFGHPNVSVAKSQQFLSPSVRRHRLRCGLPYPYWHISRRIWHNAKSHHPALGSPRASRQNDGTPELLHQRGYSLGDLGDGVDGGGFQYAVGYFSQCIGWTAADSTSGDANTPGLAALGRATASKIERKPKCLKDRPLFVPPSMLLIGIGYPQHRWLVEGLSCYL